MRKKGDKNTDVLRAVQIPTLLTKQQNDQDNKCTRHDCEPRDTFAAPNQTSERGSHQKQKKKGQRKILKSRDIRQVHNKRRVEVDCQNRIR